MNFNEAVYQLLWLTSIFLREIAGMHATTHHQWDLSSVFPNIAPISFQSVFDVFNKFAKADKEMADFLKLIKKKTDSLDCTDFSKRPGLFINLLDMLRSKDNFNREFQTIYPKEYAVTYKIATLRDSLYGGVSIAQNKLMTKLRESTGWSEWLKENNSIDYEFLSKAVKNIAALVDVDVITEMDDVKKWVKQLKEMRTADVINGNLHWEDYKYAQSLLTIIPEPLTTIN